jgi:LCP family protein required for cell wall assembly
VYFDLSSKLNQRNVDDLLGDERPSSHPSATSTVKTPGDPFAGQAVNILVMGTDSRKGDNAAVTGDAVEGDRSDTTFIAHVSADRSRIDAISIPRDTWITMPDCEDGQGGVIPQAGATRVGFNAAFSAGYEAGGEDTGVAAACAIRAVEAMSDIHIDAYVVVNFMGFVQVVDAIGGLDVNLLCAIDAPKAEGLKLPAGVSHIDGLQAVSLARARTGVGVGDGSDLSRINRQHALFNAIMNKVFAMNYVTDMPKLYGLISAGLSSITTDIGSLTQIAGLAYSMRHLTMASVYFATVPIADAGDKSHVVIIKDRAADYWQALQADQPLIDVVEGSDPATSSSAPTSAAPTDPTSESSAPVTGSAAPDTASSDSPTNPISTELPPPVTTDAPAEIQRPSDCA